MVKKAHVKIPYENNPFFIAANGITLLFNMARGVAVVLIILSVAMMFFDGGSSEGSQMNAKEVLNTVPGWSIEQWAQVLGSIAIIGLALLMISALFGGVSSYTSAELSRNNRVSIREAFRKAFNNLWAYVWLQVIIFVKLLLWSLLFILPGIYFAFRYSLAGVAFYDSKKNLRGNAAIKESLKLTKNGWLTTLGSNMLFYIITLGVLGTIVSTGTNTVLYRQFQKVGDKKPEAHWLSWLSLLLLAIMLIALAGWITHEIASGLEQG